MSSRGIVPALLACAALAACEETRYVTLDSGTPVSTPTPPPPPPPPNNPPAPPEDLKASLNDLGVPTNDTPRISNDGVPLPDSYTPFGMLVHATRDEDGNTHVGSPLEMAILGFSLDEENAFLTLVDNVPLRAPDVPTPTLPLVLHRRSNAAAAWAREDNGFEWVPPVTRRAAARGDVDGDGLYELVIARYQNSQLTLEVLDVDDPDAMPTVRLVPIPASVATVNDVRIATGDLDGDGKWEVVLALSAPRMNGQRTNTALLVLDDREQGFTVLRELGFQSSLTGVDVHAVLETGNVDYDVHDEVVLVLNEIDVTDSEGRPSRATTRLFVLADATANYAQMLADSPTVTTASESYVAQVADVAIGDFDDDDQNEIILAGVSGLTDVVGTPCNQDLVLRYLAVLYEWNGRDLGKTLVASTHDDDPIYPSNCADDGPWMMRFAFVNAVDLDGDLDHEFHINQYVFSQFPAEGARWSQAAFTVLGRSALFPQGSNGRLVFDRSTATMEAGDVNGDGRDDLLTFRAGNPSVGIDSLTDEHGFYRSGHFMVEIADETYETVPGRAINPQILPLSGDIANEGDVLALRFVEHYLDFTEPMVLAALAAPPCAELIRQNHDACTTTWGRSDTVSIEGEREFQFKSGVMIGVNYEQAVPVTGTKGFEFSVKGTFSKELALKKNESYEVTKTVSFETGPLEDSVVYSSIPYDVYRYQQIARTPGSDDAAATFDFGIPREAVIRLATARYYNAHTLPNALKIDEEVFTHRAGEVDSYPDAAERDEILSRNRSQVQDLRTECPYCWSEDPENRSPFDARYRTFEPFAALPGLFSREVGVGEGSGSTEVGVELNVTNGIGRSLERSVEVEVELVVGLVVSGFQLGGGVSHSTTLSRSEGKSYVGTVGSIHEQDFNANQYRFGMFTYLQADPGSGLEFEVINYWVEE